MRLMWLAERPHDLKLTVPPLALIDEDLRQIIASRESYRRHAQDARSATVSSTSLNA